VELETSFLARYSGRTVVVHDAVKIRKISGVAYKMKRMNANKKIREDTAIKEMRNLLGFRYGGGHWNPAQGGLSYRTWSNAAHDKLPPDNDMAKNPSASFTNRRGTWFDDYTTYRPYLPTDAPLFQFPWAEVSHRYLDSECVVGEGTER
jgi:hypothetical protein